jgi:hypothetical protein
MKRTSTVLWLLAIVAVVGAAQPRTLGSFSSERDPLVVTRELAGRLTVLPVSLAQYWGNPGTRLAGVTGELAGDRLSLVLRSANGFADGVSYFFYLFAERSPGTPSAVTFELVPSLAGRAVAVAWVATRPTPILAGSATVRGDELSWTLELSRLPRGILDGIGQSATIDLTAAWRDAESAAWEEYYFATFVVGDLMP